MVHIWLNPGIPSSNAQPAKRSSAGAFPAGSRAIHTPVPNVDLQDREVWKMGEVVAVIKIMPDGVDVDLEKLKENLAAAVPAGTDLNGIAEEPIAFGLVALMATIVVGDVEGGTEPAEKAFAEVPNVESVQVAEIGRLL